MNLLSLKHVLKPEIADRRGLWRFVISVTLVAWAGALSVEVADQLTFFTTWAAAWRDWALSSFEVLAISIPIARWFGLAQLELHRAKAHAEELSRIDPLTGLANRRAFYEAAARLRGGALALVIADIDGFKRFNDRHGHAAGDEVIRSVAARMEEELGDLGTVARLGGEEFALVCADPSACELFTRLQDFRRRVADEPIAVGGQTLRATISIGFSTRQEEHFDALYAAADKALYAAKSAGRDCVVDFQRLPVLQRSPSRRYRARDDLRQVEHFPPIAEEISQGAGGMTALGAATRRYRDDEPLIMATPSEATATRRRELPEFDCAAILVFFSPLSNA